MLNAQISVFVQLNPRSGLGSKCAIRHLGPAMAECDSNLQKEFFARKVNCQKQREEKCCSGLGDACDTRVSPSCFQPCVEVDLSHQDRPECT